MKLASITFPISEKTTTKKLNVTGGNWWRVGAVSESWGASWFSYFFNTTAYLLLQRYEPSSFSTKGLHGLPRRYKRCQSWKPDSTLEVALEGVNDSLITFERRFNDVGYHHLRKENSLSSSSSSLSPSPSPFSLLFLILLLCVEFQS